MARSRIIAQLDSGVVLIMMRIVNAEKDEIQASNRIAYSCLVKIIQPVIGEVGAVCASRFGYGLGRYVDPVAYLTGKLSFAPNPHPPATIEAMKLAIRLNRYIGEVKGTDSLFVAQGLLDKDIDVIYTNDSVLNGYMVRKFIKMFVDEGGRDRTLTVSPLVSYP